MFLVRDCKSRNLRLYKAFQHNFFMQIKAQPFFKCVYGSSVAINSDLLLLLLLHSIPIELAIFLLPDVYEDEMTKKKEA
jgi:hypothetical protein